MAGHPKYEISSGKIILDSNEITEFKPEERSKLGIFLSFQNIPEIRGIKM
jgi:Fe-S cluster assembly ATP-binding protein